MTPPQYRRIDVGDGAPVLRRALCVEQAPPGLIVTPILEGICRSDLKELAGSRAQRRDWGHEFVARVVEAGPGFVPGERVVLDPDVSIRRTSGFAEYVLATGSAEQLRRAFRTVSASVPDAAAKFVEPLACAIHCVAKFRAAALESRRPISDVAILGAGVFGVLIGLLLQGEYRGELFNRSTSVVGAIEQLRLFKSGSVFSLQSIRARSADAAIVTTSELDLATVHRAVECSRPDGLVVLFAGTSPHQRLGASLPDVDVVRRRELRLDWPSADGLRTFVGTHGANARDFERALTSCTAIPVERLVARRVAVADLESTLRELLIPAPRPPGRVVVQFGQAGV